jgi:hypothetical protein
VKRHFSTATTKAFGAEHVRMSFKENATASQRKDGATATWKKSERAKRNFDAKSAFRKCLVKYKLRKRFAIKVMAKLVTADTDFYAMSQADLLCIIQTHTKRMADEVLILARAFVAYESKGGDVEAVTRWMREYLVGVAQGMILPDVLVRFAESRYLINRIAAMPIKDQLAVIEGGTVEVIVGETDGGIEMADKNPLDLNVREISQVFSPDGIRDSKQQIEWINAQSTPTKPREQKPRTPRAPVPAIAPTSTKAEQETWSDIPESKYGFRQVILRLSAVEDDLLAMAAANKRMSKDKLIYNLARSAGIIG